jgi:hypothetical protein
VATAQIENLKTQLKKDPDDRRRIEGELKLVLAQLSALKRRACPGLIIGNAPAVRTHAIPSEGG